MQRIGFEQDSSDQLGLASNIWTPQLKKCTSEFALFRPSGLDILNTHPNIPMLALGLRLFEHHLYCSSFHSLDNLMRSAEPYFCVIDNVPSHMKNFHQTNTITNHLVRILQDMERRAKEGKDVSSRELLENIQIKQLTQFSIMCFLRARALLQLETHSDTYAYKLLGNQQDNLCDYSMEIRGVCLEIIVDSIGCLLNINSGNEQQKYGSTAHNPIEVELTVQQQKWVLSSSVAHARLARQFLARYQLKPEKYLKIPERQLFRSRSPLQNIPPYIQRMASQSVQKKAARNCAQCGKEKTERFCQCRKNRLQVSNKENIVVIN